MKTSVAWLNEYIRVPWPVAELTERLTLAGLEVEGVETTFDLPETVVVGQILERAPHPNADRLSVCSVDAGTGIPLTIVCGAPNCDAGKRVPVALVGTEMAEGFVIKRAKLRGVSSEGMLCSSVELGLDGDHSGLMELADDAPVGDPLISVLRPDTVIDWEVTPNRPDWLSHLGIAREIAAVAGTPDALTFPDTAFPTAGDSVADVAGVEILDPDLCPRYTARIIRHVRIKPSPEWMQRALSAVGIRPINNVVDITNYVMMECGQPLHAFDFALLREHRIVVRRAAEGEVMTTLDAKVHELSRDDLLIADAQGGVALAGVMGGLNSEIRDTTSTVLLESAAFAPAAIRATARRLGVSTESSHRFERGVGLDMVEFASRRAACLMAQLAEGEVLDGVIDVYPGRCEPAVIDCRFQKVCDLLGVSLPSDDVCRYLTNLGLVVLERDAERVRVRVPSYRLDLEREVDLVEEVARLHGLHNIPEDVAAAKVGGGRAQDQYYPLEQVREELLGLGLDETMTYSLLGEEAACTGTGVGRRELVRLANPLSAELAFMRPSLTPGVLQTLEHNVSRDQTDLRLFELGRVIRQGDDAPEERYQACILVTGRRYPERFGGEREIEMDFYDLKGLVEDWLQSRRVPVADCVPAEDPAFAPGVCAAVTGPEGRTLVVLGRVRPELLEGMRLSHPVYMALANLDDILDVTVPPARYEQLPQFPATVRDIAMLVRRSVTHRDVLRAVAEAREPLLEKVELFDIFEDESTLGADRRSMAYSFTYRDPERTLTDKQVNKVHDGMRAMLAERLGAELR